MTPPRKFSALPPQICIEASPKAISRRTSYLRVRLEFLPYPHLIATLFNGCAFGPPRDFTPASSWTWVDHPVSGLPVLTLALFRLGFPAAPRLDRLTLPAPATRRTVLQKVRGCACALPQLVNIGFQVLFHSPPGVLFTFPSRYSFTIGYQVVFSLTGWSPLFHTRFPVSRTTLDSTYPNLSFIYWTFTVFGSPSQMILLDLLVVYGSPYPICISTYGLGSFWFARHYYRNHCLFSLPMGT